MKQALKIFKDICDTIEKDGLTKNEKIINHSKNSAKNENNIQYISQLEYHLLLVIPGVISLIITFAYSIDIHSFILKYLQTC